MDLCSIIVQYLGAGSIMQSLWVRLQLIAVTVLVMGGLIWAVDAFTVNFNPCAKAHRLEDQGKLDEAERIYSDLIKQNPQNANARLGLASVYQTRGNYTAATPQLDAAIAQLTKSGAVISGDCCSTTPLYRAYYNLANGYYCMQNYDKCVAACSAVLSKTMDCDCFFLRGCAYKMLNKLKESEKDLNDGIALDASNGRQPEERYLHKRADVRVALGRKAEALADYNLALQTKVCAQAFFDRAMLYKDMNNLGQCRADLDSAVKNDSGMESAYHERARLLMEAGKNTEALSDLAIAEKLNPACNEVKEDRATIAKALKK
jgi:tetratricopeptide (TPR) repeat protein